MDIRVNECHVGQVVTDMNGHVPNIGDVKGWDVEGLFEITGDQFHALLAKLPTDGELIQNKMARVVSFTQGTVRCEGQVTSMLVIYQNDHTYWCATLFNPGLFAEPINHDDSGMYLVRVVDEYRFDVYQNSSGVVVASAATKDTALKAAAALNACAVVPRLVNVSPNSDHNDERAYFE